MTSDTPQKLEIDWLKTAGGAFAAVSSALLLSTLGAAGTIIGAALGSVIVTVGGALYTQGLARSRERLAHVQTAALRKVGVAQAEVRRAARRQGDDEAVDAHLAYADERLDDVHEDLGAIADEPTGPAWRERLVTLPWRRISLVAAGLFAAAVLAITAFELVAGESVSSITGGSDGGSGPTIGRITGGSDEHTPPKHEKAPTDGGSTPSEAPSSEPSDQPTPTDEPTDQPTDQSTAEPTPSPEATTPAPTPTAPAAPQTEVPDPAAPTG
jgi:hypothetical protein